MSRLRTKISRGSVVHCTPNGRLNNSPVNKCFLSIKKAKRALEEAGTTLSNVEVVSEITEEYLISRYTEVKVFDKWCSISKYVGVLVFMYNNHYSFK